MRASTRRKKNVVRALICVLPYMVDRLSQLLLGSFLSDVKKISCYLRDANTSRRKGTNSGNMLKVCLQNCCVRQWMAKKTEDAGSWLTPVYSVTRHLSVHANVFFPLTKHFLSFCMCHFLFIYIVLRQTLCWRIYICLTPPHQRFRIFWVLYHTIR